MLSVIIEYKLIIQLEYFILYFQTECANQCTDRYVAFNQKLMFTFVQHQNKKNKALEEATQAAIAAGNLPPQMAAP